MTPDADDEARNLLKKSVNRLHAVKDDLRHVSHLTSDDSLLRIAYGVELSIHELNRVVAERRPC